MIPTWTLIIVVLNHGMAMANLTRGEFYTLQACEAARADLPHYTAQGYDIRATCELAH